jgi:dihydrofolate reductase
LGGAGLISTLVNLNLVDVFRLAVFPVILGDGTPLFREIKRRVKLKLLEVKSGKSGVAELRYEKLTE